MSLWSDYVSERFGWETIETEGGFIAFHLAPPNCTVKEMFVRPEYRGTSLAKRLADMVFSRAREAGATHMWAEVTPGLPGSDQAMRSNLHYGFKLIGNRGEQTVMMKEIGGV